MKDLIITPELAQETEFRNRPALLIVSKMNITFNQVAVNRLQLKKGVMFKLAIKDLKMYYKDVATGGFTINHVDNKGARLISKGLHSVLSENWRKNEKSFRFEIGDFAEGQRPLTEIV